MLKINDNKIKDVFLGSTPIVKAYMGSELVYKRLPYDAEIEYLESTGTQYISTGIVLTDYDNTIETKITYLGYSNTTNWISWFGTYRDEDTNVYRIIKYNSNDKILVYNGRRANGGGTTYNVTIGTTYNIKLYPTYGKINNNTIQYTSKTGNQNTETIRIFNLSSKLRIFNFKLTKGNTIILDVIPVRVGQVGYMYDKVSGQLFGNSGTGNFILGPDIN